MAAFGFPFDQAADMIIRSNDGHEFTVHRIMIESAFKDVIGTTDGRGVLNLPEKGQTLDNVLRFVYGHDFKVFAPKARAEDADKDLAAFAKTCDAAEKYNIPGLQEYLLGKVRQALPRTPMDGKLKIVAALCGDDFRGKIAQDVVRSMLAEQAAHVAAPEPQPALAPPVQVPGGDKFDSIKVKKRTSKSASGLENGDLQIVKVRKVTPKTPATTSAISHATTEKHCVCEAAADDATLLQCDGCDRWYHPGCVGKGQYPPKTYANSPNWAKKRDVSFYQGKAFMCRTCEPDEPQPVHHNAKPANGRDQADGPGDDARIEELVQAGVLKGIGT